MSIDEKRGLMVQFPISDGREYVFKNIGDYIQCIAAKQYIEKIDEYIEQEKANKYQPKDNKTIRLIMNGFFQWRAESWPPSKYIHPLLISMHITPVKEKELLNKEGIEFLRKWGPVGCRDIGTKELLDKYDIPAYFSGCLTLTLGKKYSTNNNRKGYIFVDPFFDAPINESRLGVSFEQVLFLIGVFLRHPIMISRLFKNIFFSLYSSDKSKGFLELKCSNIRRLYKTACFYHMYSKVFTNDILKNATYINHFEYIKVTETSNDELIEKAEKLIWKYASAKMVITSRIHAALPALALDTPLIFIDHNEVSNSDGKFNFPGRLDGLLQLFRVFNVKDNVFSTEDEFLKGSKKIDMGFNLINKDDWKKYAKMLDEKCTEFMQ